MLTHEDLLRELELLPVWQLRAPLPSQLALPQTAPEPVVQTIATAVLIETVLEEALPNPTEQVIAPALAAEPQALDQPVFRHIESEEGDWLFVLPNTVPSADETRLLRNILMAMAIKTKPKEALTTTADMLATVKPKCVLAMGETVAQYLAQSTESLASLRGTVHAWHGIALVATYDLAHLLCTLPDKAKAWDDLCLAMQALQRLKSVN